MKIRTLVASTAFLLLAACGGAADSDQSGSTEQAPASQDAAAPAPAAAPNPGKTAFLQCAACHTIEAGGPNRVGPNLAGIVGRKSGQAPGFKYSAAMQAKGVTWDEATLDIYLKQPQKFVPGTSMAFPGVADDKRRADIIAYLKSPGV